MEYVLVTGANGGMGRRTVENFVNKGYTVFALDLNPCEMSDRVISVTADVTDENSVKAAYQFIRSKTDNLSLIVHFAGIYLLNSLMEVDAKTFKRAFDINFFGAYIINKTFLPLIKKGGKIIMTTSELASIYPLPFTGIYAVTKTALDRYAYSLKMELQLLDISVSVLRAGAVDTGMLSVSTKALDDFCQNTKLYSCNAKRFKKIVDSVEARRVPPQAIADKVCKIYNKKRPKFAYSINRNPLLIMLNLLPKRLQLYIIKKVLQ